MELEPPKRFFFFSTVLISTFILLMGSWWLFLTFKLSRELEAIGLQAGKGDILNMVKWEGSVFFLLVLIAVIAQFYMYLADRRKSETINLFFASLTHELKTPLASIKMQSQMLEELIKELPDNKKDELAIYLSRLHISSRDLEFELDKHLQLARGERDGNLSKSALDLDKLIEKISSDYPGLMINKSTLFGIVETDEFAMTIIIRNIFDNCYKHAQSKKINISKNQGYFCFHTPDHFKGEAKKIGKLFYKYNSTRGSGLGLYMIKKLIHKMQGTIDFELQDGFLIRFKLL